LAFFVSYKSPRPFRPATTMVTRPQSWWQQTCPRQHRICGPLSERQGAKGNGECKDLTE
jgi:hypothetical protein